MASFIIYICTKLQLFIDFQVLGEFGFKENDTQKYCVLMSGTLKFPPTLVIYITAFAFPAIIIAGSYGHTCYHVWQKNKDLKSFSE